MKKFPWFEVLLILVILSSHAYAAASPEKSLMNWFRVDDAYYYFNTAKNISNGLGVTFDGINPTNGFHPLWMLVCIPIFSLARFNLYLPFRILVILLGVLNAATAILLYRWLTRVLSIGAGVLGAIIWALSPLIHSITSESGLETGLSVFLLILLMSLMSETSLSTAKIPTRKLIITGVIAALAFFGRLDNIFIIFMLGIWFVFANIPIRYYLVLDALFIMLATFMSLLIRPGTFIDIYTYSSGIFIFLGLGLIIKIPIYYFFGLYQPSGSPSLVILLRKSVIAVTIGEVITAIPLLLLTFTNAGFPFPKSLPLIDFVITLILVIGLRLLACIISAKHPGIMPTPLQILKRHWKSWLRNGTCYFGILLVAVLGYAIYNIIFFQTPLPVSGQIKQWWGTMYTVYGVPASTFSDSLGIGTLQWSLVSSLLSFPGKIIPSSFIFLVDLLFIIIVAYLILKNTEIVKRSIDSLLLLPILGGCFWQIWTYSIRSYVGFRDWYWVTQLIFSVLFLILLYHLVISTIQKPALRNLVITGSLVLIGVTIFSGYISSVTQLINYKDPCLEEGEYLFGVSFLESNTEPGAIIGFTGGGTIAYFIHDRTIVNLDGLINSNSYFQALKNFKAAEFLNDMGMDYIFARPYIIMESEPYKHEFPDRLKFMEYSDSYALYGYLTVP
jgi:hypothetical protein